MKKLFAVVLVFALLVSFAACGNDEKKEEPVVTDVPTVAPTDEPTKEPEDNPTEEITSAPTEEPEPTPNPRNCTVIETLPEYV